LLIYRRDGFPYWILLMLALAAAPWPAAAGDVERAIQGHLAHGKQLLQEGQHAAAQAEFRAVLQLDATHQEALRLMTKAQRALEAERTKTAKSRMELRDKALDIAVKVAQDLERDRRRKDANARDQFARAREQQVKLYYTKGLSLYREGKFQDAIDTWQQMAMLDPNHALVRETQRLITRAETKQAEMRAKASARMAPGVAGAPVAALEGQLTAKRIEIETLLKYAKLAEKDDNYDLAIGLLQRVLVEDASEKRAQQMLERVQMAKLKRQEDTLEARVERDEQAMLNDVMAAQVLPEAKPAKLLPPPPARQARGMSDALRQPISLDFKDVPLADVLDFIADAANVSIIPSPQLDLKSRLVSLNVKDLPLELALKYLAKNQSLAYHISQDAVLIAAPDELANAPMQTRVFFLHSGLGPFALETAAIEPNPALTIESIKDLVQRTVPQPPGSKLVVDERGGSLVMTNTADSLAQTERLLSQLDITPVQVLIEARFIELVDTDLSHLGVESVLTGAAALDKKTAGDGTRDVGTGIASGGGHKFPALSREGEGANITLQGVLTGTQFETVLHLLEESQKTKTLSAPRVTALNNRTAQIRVVDEFNYPTRYEVSLIQFDINGDGDFDDAGETEFANVPQDFKKRDVGILLNVTPSVGQDGKTITLVLAPEVSAFSSFRDLGGGVTVPQFTSSQLTTSVVIEDGQTVALGGLMKDVTTQELTKVPFFGDLPLVGNLFRQNEEASTRRNLLIFITARLLAPRGPTT
jgi:type II secretory pathway component GspD/PulD (secretin)